MPEPSTTGPYLPDPDDREAIAAGTVVAGKYKLLEAIGEGGMGEVWMAQQIEPVKRTIALKLIKSGMDSKTVVARFEAERQALSMMDHPNIARVLDVGATSAGRPFFVMELVKGTPITDFCDQRKLTPRQRLELFVPVCLAIQHAHQKGIIHRDIKPSNVLVALHDDKPVPKVIDFGVAKATGTPLTEKTLHTAFEQVVGTPAYMSPEQATFNQLDIDTRSDVYSLGVLLYELLTGTTPIERERFKQAALMEILRVVREEEPPRPSTRLSSTVTKASIAAQRGTEPARLTKELRAELDWVVMKSLEKDRTRRYETASGFAADVQRYLGGEAVQAHPPSVSYRMKKFIRKHTGLAIAAPLIFLALIGAAAGTVYGWNRAEAERLSNAARQQAEQDRDVANSLRRDVSDALDREHRTRVALEQAREREHALREGMEKLTSLLSRRSRNLANPSTVTEAMELRAQAQFLAPTLPMSRNEQEVLAQLEREFTRAIIRARGLRAVSDAEQCVAEGDDEAKLAMVRFARRTLPEFPNDADCRKAYIRLDQLEMRSAPTGTGSAFGAQVLFREAYEDSLERFRTGDLAGGVGSANHAWRKAADDAGRGRVCDMTCQALDFFLVTASTRDQLHSIAAALKASEDWLTDKRKSRIESVVNEALRREP